MIKIENVEVFNWESAYKNGYEAGKKDALTWINKKDKLPDPFKEVLTFDGERIGFGMYDDELRMWVLPVSGYATSITHWLPLPEVPEKENKK